MLWFPQLITGATVQFPARRRSIQRTVVNELADGSRVKLADPGARAVEWQLELSGLGAAEWRALETLMEASEGRLRSFTFLDPFGNLLAWSEDLSAAAWSKDGGLQLTAGVADPLGGPLATAVTNASGAALAIWQTLAVPSGFRYCLSLYVRSEAGADITAFVGTAATAAELIVAAGPAWRRVEHVAQLAAGEEAVSFGLKVSANSTVQVFGLQAEAQAGASAYKKTGAHGGVYANAHFEQDTLVLTSDAPGAYAGEVKIRAAD